MKKPEAIGSNRHSACCDSAVRRRLLLAAADLFSRKGYAPTSVSEIVTAAGVTKPTLYYYFHNKEGVFLEIMNEGAALFRKIVEEVERHEGSGVTERIHLLCDRIIEISLRSIAVIRLIHAIYYGPPQGAPAFDFDVFHRRLFQTLLGMVREGVDQGEMRSADTTDITWTILGLMNVCIDSNLGDPEHAMTRDGFKRSLNLVFAGIAPGRQLA